MIQHVWRIAFVIVLIGSGSLSTDYRILEELGFTNATSFDLYEMENGEQALKVVNSIPNADPSLSSPREVVEVVAHSSKQARMHMSRKTNRKLVSGQIRSVLLGQELAEQGLWEHLDTLVRDPSIGERVKIAVVRGDAGQLLKQEYPQFPDTGTYVHELLEKESAVHTIPDVNLHHFTREYFDDGIDPVAPIIKQTADSIEIDGIALFRQDRMVERIEPDQSVFFSILYKNFKQGEVSVHLGEHEHVSFSSIVSKRKISVRSALDHEAPIEVQFNVKIKGTLLEYIGDKAISTEKDRQKLIREMETFFENEATKLIEISQQAAADCFGIGQYVRNSMSAKEWYGMDWQSVYPNVRISVNIDLLIKNFGKFQ